MAFTSFTYGDPAINNPTLSVLISFTGPPLVGVNSAPAPVASALAGGIVGTAYSETISAVGGAGGYTFAVHSGSLPASCSLNTSTGVISGTPSSAATSTFTIRVTDTLGVFGDQSFTIIIASSGGGSVASNYGWIG